MGTKRHWCIGMIVVVCLLSAFLVTQVSREKPQPGPLPLPAEIFVPLRIENVVPSNDELLSVEETIGLALYRGIEGGHLYPRVNPEAKGTLYELLAIPDEALYEFQCNAYGLLGHMGDASDVLKMRDVLESYSGVLSKPQSRRVMAIIYSLGTLSRRGIDPAPQILDEMSRFEYWVGRFQLTPVELAWPATRPIEYQWLHWVLDAQRLAQRHDLAEFRDNILNQNVSDRHRRDMAELIENYRKRGVPAEELTAARKPVTETDHKGLQDYYNRRESLIQGLSKETRDRFAKQGVHLPPTTAQLPPAFRFGDQ